MSYPQTLQNFKTYPLFDDTCKADLYPPYKVRQVLDKKGENRDIHKIEQCLSTTTIFK